MEILLAYHRYTVEGLILVMLLNIALPHLAKDDLLKTVFISRIGFFLFWTLWSMVAFTGLVTLVFSRMNLTSHVWEMIFLIFLLPILDAYRAIRIRNKYWLNKKSGLLFSNIIVGFELFLTLLVTILAWR
jgi:hypothetical protein